MVQYNGQPTRIELDIDLCTNDTPVLSEMIGKGLFTIRLIMNVMCPCLYIYCLRCVLYITGNVSSISPVIFYKGCYKGYELAANTWTLTELLSMQTTDGVIRFRYKDKCFVLNKLNITYKKYCERKKYGYVSITKYGTLETRDILGPQYFASKKESSSPNSVSFSNFIDDKL